MFPELITDLLQEGYKVSFKAPGHSMFPTIMANENIVVEPINPGMVRMGDIILYRTNGRLIAHRVVGIEREINAADISANQVDTDGLSREFIEGDSPLIKHSAHQVKRSLNEVLHFVLRGDASPAYDAPVKAGQILGKVVSLERNGCSIDPYGFTYKLGCFAILWGGRIKRLPRMISSIFSLYGR
jgi:hypothetical protein